MKHKNRGKRLHTRNRYLRNHGFPVASPLWTSSGIFQRDFTIQWCRPKDCRLSSGFLLEPSNGVSVAFSNGVSLL